jgi:hypothetical protein
LDIFFSSREDGLAGAVVAEAISLLGFLDQEAYLTQVNFYLQVRHNSVAAPGQLVARLGGLPARQNVLSYAKTLTLALTRISDRYILYSKVNFQENFRRLVEVLSF